MKKPRVQPKHVLTVGSALSAVVLGLELMGFLQYEGAYVSSGIMLLAFGLVIAVDYYNERGNGTRMADVVAFAVVGSALVLGLVCVASFSIVGWEKLVGFMFVLLAGVMTYSMLRDKKEEQHVKV